MTRLEFPNEPIDGRVKHAHHYDGTHGCSDHFHIQPHHEGCKHAHKSTGHLVSIDAECGFRRDENGDIVAMAG